MYIHKIYELFIYTQVLIHKINHMQLIDMLIMSIVRVSLLKISHTEFWCLMFHISKIQAMISTGNRLIITKVLKIHKIITHGVKGGHFLNEFVDFRQQVSHSIRVKVLYQTSILTSQWVWWGVGNGGPPNACPVHCCVLC